MDKSTLGGITVALAGILAGLLLEGGKIGQILQPTAAIIVFGGTIGAVMVQFPLKTVIQSLVQFKQVIWEPEPEADNLIQHLLRYAYRARKDGLVSLDSELDKIHDPFLRDSLALAVDGVNCADLRKMMEVQLDYQLEKNDVVVKVYEAAAGYSPTIGIIGAVLGLIQVMQHLQNIDEVGKGIAVAFVATIYGVAAANLVFLPAAGKLRIRLREKQAIQEMTLEGVLAIMEGINPRALQMRLNSYSSRPSLRVAAPMAAAS
jgi:chemotaxis protein MotA